MGDLGHRKLNILPITAMVLLCLCLLSFWKVGSVYGKLTDHEGVETDSDASRYYDYEKATPSEITRVEVESRVIEIPEPEPVEGYGFIGWNTKEDGTGTWYYPGDLYEMTLEQTNFYAIWENLKKATPSDASVPVGTSSDAVFTGGSDDYMETSLTDETTAIEEIAEVVSEESALIADVVEVTEITEITEIEITDNSTEENTDGVTVPETEPVSETSNTESGTTETGTGDQATIASAEVETEASLIEAEEAGLITDIEVTDDSEGFDEGEPAVSDEADAPEEPEVADIPET